MGGLFSAAPLDQPGELVLLEGAVPVAVDLVPLVLQGRLQDHHAVREGHFATSGLAVQLPSGGEVTGALRAVGPHLEEHRGSEAWRLRLILVELSADDVHEPVRRVLVVGHAEALRLEVLLGSGGRPQIHGLAALAEQQHVVEEREEGEAGLVDDHDAGHAELGHLLQRGADRDRAARVETRGGLVQEEQGRLRRQLQADVDALPLAAADAPLLHAAHDAVLDVDDLHHVEDVVRDVLDPLPLRADLVPQPRRELDLLTHREVLVDDVVLRHEAHDGLDVPDLGGVAVDLDRSAHVPVRRLTAEHVHEGCLAGAGGPHDGAHPAALELAGDPVQDPLPLGPLQGQAEVLERDGDALRFHLHAAELVLLQVPRRHEVRHHLERVRPVFQHGSTRLLEFVHARRPPLVVDEEARDEEAEQNQTQSHAGQVLASVHVDIG
mmetsp:Transcript_33905/g.89873  ORF Transcript_33905/g.89873 Transcript_33905/m.89873 type:complete len:437 (-) Transcript_33905:193-1503(-)